MKTFFTLLLLAGSLLTYAQPTLSTGSYGLQPGNTSSVYIIEAPLPPAGNPGANITWDFSTAVVDTSVNYTVYDPASSALSATYPAATILYNQSASGQNVQAFYEMLQDSVVYHGYKLTIAAQGIVLTQQAIFTDPEKVLTLPMSFQQIDTDSFGGPFTSLNSAGGGTMNYFRSGTITTEYDGYGTLITPFTTYQNVIRVHSSEIYKDTLDGIPGFQFDFESDIYYWFREGDKFPLAQHTTLLQNALPQTTFVVYNPWATSIDDLSSNISTTVFPNPANEVLNIQFELAYPQPATIRMYNASGQVVRQKTLESNSSSSYETDFVVQDLTTGMYLIEILSNSSRTVKKVQVQ